MNAIQAYINFILRPLPTHDTPSGADVVDNFYLKIALWSSFFIVLFQLVPLLSKTIFPTWYNSLVPRKRKEFPSYVVCLVHHFALVPIAWYHVIQDFSRSGSELQQIDYAPIEAIVAPFCLGYLISDTVCFAISEMLAGRLEYIIHHVMTVWLVMTTMYASGHITRFIPHLLICDTTNVFFNTAWLMRTAGLQGNAFVTFLELAFAVAFLFCRAINMPMAFFAVSQSPMGQSLGWARLTLIPIVLLQWYWFAKILLGMKSRLSPSSSSKKGKDL